MTTRRYPQSTPECRVEPATVAQAALRREPPSCRRRVQSTSSEDWHASEKSPRVQAGVDPARVHSNRDQHVQLVCRLSPNDTFSPRHGTTRWLLSGAKNVVERIWRRWLYHACQSRTY